MSIIRGIQEMEKLAIKQEFARQMGNRLMQVGRDVTSHARKGISTGVKTMGEKATRTGKMFRAASNAPKYSPVRDASAKTIRSARNLGAGPGQVRRASNPGLPNNFLQPGMPMPPKIS